MSKTTYEPAADARASAVAAVARAGEPDRYLAALLARSPERQAMLALAAFSAELARVPYLVSREPAVGSIRLQWWREALELPAHLRAGSEVADAVRAAALTYQLPAPLLASVIDACSTQLEAGPLPSNDALRGYLWNAEGSQFALAARVLDGATGAGVEAACAAAGEAYGLVRLLMDLPRSLSLGRIPLSQPQIAAAGLSPEELLAGAETAKIGRLLGGCREQIGASLDLARRLAREFPRTTRVGFLPLALVGTYLRAVEQTMPSGLRAQARIAPLTRVCRIAAAHWLGRP